MLEIRYVALPGGLLLNLTNSGPRNQGDRARGVGSNHKKYVKKFINHLVQNYLAQMLNNLILSITQWISTKFHLTVALGLKLALLLGILC